ncbi:MAG: HEAT repeat domain-containing protein [Chloroflexi bacterium]|nr:HEAT repeat domain-containing protein [Chloroflexota bacterium]
MRLFGSPNVEKMAAKHDVMGLCKALSYEKDPQIRCQAAQALATLRDARAVEPLIASLVEDSRHRDAKAGVLGRIGDARAAAALSAALLQETDFDRAAKVFEALGQIGHVHAIGPLIAALTGPEPLASLRAVHALEKIGGPAVEPLLAALHHETWPYEIIRALGLIGDARAVEPLIDFLGGELPVVSSAAAAALGRIGDLRAVGPLVAVLHSDNWWLQGWAAPALEQILKAHPLAPLEGVAQALERYYEAKETRAAEQRAKEGARRPAFRGGLGEPYCSQECYDRAALYAMLDIPDATCSLCGTRAFTTSAGRNYAVIPYEGKTWVICRSCVPTMQARLQSAEKCAMCQKGL